MNRQLDVATSTLTSAIRLGAGWHASHAGTRKPEKTLELYEFEACPFCRKVREALSMFDLDAMIYPCPKGGNRFRSVVLEKGDKAMFPFLVDPNTGKSLYESSDINRYLAAEYGDGRVPLLLSLGPLTTINSSLASLARFTKGVRARPSRAPEKPLELWSFEASPYCRLVREVLCELEIPYLLHNVGKHGAGRPAFRERSGKMMVPYLVDPNSGTEMFESVDIISYLNRSYAL